MASPGVCACRGTGFCKPGFGRHARCTAEKCTRCKPGKHPMTPRGLDDASTDPEQIAKWWRIAPTANIGVAVPDGVVVVDVDPRNGGVASFDALAASNGFPQSRMAHTGGGGAHLYFRVPLGLQFPGQLAEGIDLKQLGGYVLAPPSNHVSGNLYSWVSAPEAPIADAPPWLAGMGRPRGERSATVIVDDEDERTVDDATLDGVAATIEPHFAHGKMHHICKNLGGWLKQRGFSPADVKYVVERLPCKNHEDGVEAALAAFGIEKAFGWKELQGFIGAAPAAALDAATPNPRREQARAEADGLLQAMAASAVVLQPHAPAPASPLPAPLAATMPPPPLPAGAGLPSIVGDPRGSQFWICRGADYHTPVSKSMLPARAAEAGHRLYAQNGEPVKLKADDLAASAVIAERVVRDFTATGIRWFGDTRAIVHGYALPRVAPVYDAGVDAWLQLLAGPRYGHLAQWFATCAQERIHALAACLVLIGGTGIGKTLIATLAARTWGEPSAVPLSHAIDKFNSTITKCPVVLDDEAARMKKGDVGTNDFREMLSARERTYEPKGVDKRELRGCQRFVITCNAFSDLRFSDVGSLEVVEALADRLLVVKCGKADDVRAALEPLREHGSDNVNFSRVDPHIAWLIANTPVPMARFLASPGRNDPAARQAVLDGLIQRYPDLFAQVREATERGEYVSPADPPPIFVHGGAVWVRGERLAFGQLTSRDIYRALAPWELAPRREVVRVGGAIIRARAYDVARLLEELRRDAA